MSHVRTIQTTIAQVGIPFTPKHDPTRNLAEEIEVRNTIYARVVTQGRRLLVKYDSISCSNSISTFFPFVE